MGCVCTRVCLQKGEGNGKGVGTRQEKASWMQAVANIDAGAAPLFSLSLALVWTGWVWDPAWLHSQVQPGPEKLTHGPSHQQDLSLIIPQWSKIHQMPPLPLPTEGC